MYLALVGSVVFMGKFAYMPILAYIAYMQLISRQRTISGAFRN